MFKSLIKSFENQSKVIQLFFIIVLVVIIATIDFALGYPVKNSGKDRISQVIWPGNK